MAIEEKLKKLENKIDDVSKQLNATQQLIHEQHVVDSYEEKSQMSFYYKGLVMGLLLGVVGNLFVSYLVKVFDFMNLPLWSWGASTLSASAVILLLVGLITKEIKKLSEEMEAWKREYDIK